MAFDAATNSGYQAAQSTYSWSHTCTGSDRFLSVDVSLLSAGATVSSITYNGVALSLIGVQSTVTAFGRVECWGLVAPDSGSHTIAVTLSSSIASAGTAVSYADVHQTIPTEAFNSAQATNAGSATDASVVATPVADNCIIHAALVTDDGSVAANQTTRNNVTGAIGSGANEDTGPVTPAAATTMSYTGLGIVATWAMGAYAIRPTSYLATYGESLAASRSPGAVLVHAVSLGKDAAGTQTRAVQTALAKTPGLAESAAFDRSLSFAVSAVIASDRAEANDGAKLISSAAFNGRDAVADSCRANTYSTLVGVGLGHGMTWDGAVLIADAPNLFRAKARAVSIGPAAVADVRIGRRRR